MSFISFRIKDWKEGMSEEDYTNHLLEQAEKCFIDNDPSTIAGVIVETVGGSTIGFPQAIDAFVKQFVNGGLVPTYTTVMGFGYVMSYTKCADHLVNALVRPLAKVPMLVIPGAVVITWILNIVLPSAVGIAAAVGVLLIPALIALKVRPVMAAAAVFLGTWGSVVSPGLMFNPQIADIAFKAGEIESPDAMIVIFAEFFPAFVGSLIAAVALAFLAVIMKEGVGSQNAVQVSQESQTEEFKVNSLHKGIVVKKIQKGCFVKVEHDLECFVSNMHLPKNLTVKVGDDMEIRVIEFSAINCKLSGSHKDVHVDVKNQKLGNFNEGFMKKGNFFTKTSARFGDIDELMNLSKKLKSKEEEL